MDEKVPSLRVSQMEAKELKKFIDEFGEAIVEEFVHSMRENSSVVITIPPANDDQKSIDMQQREQWLRAAVLGANDGLVTTASLMMGVGAVKKDSKTVVMPGLAALVEGACSMDIGEYVSVQTQRDAKETNLKREKESRAPGSPVVLSKEEKKGLPNPILAAFASALAFAVGAALPLLSAAFSVDYVIRVSVVSGVSTVVLVVFGAIGAHFGRSSVWKGSLRVLIGGWLPCR